MFVGDHTTASTSLAGTAAVAVQRNISCTIQYTRCCTLFKWESVFLSHADCRRWYFRLVGDVLIRTAFVSYAGPFSLTDRDTLIDGWLQPIKLHNIPFTDNADVIGALVDADTVCSLFLRISPVFVLFLS